MYSVDSLARSLAASRREGSSLEAYNNAVFGALMDCSFKLVAIKLVTASKEHLEKHYADLSDKPFFKGLVSCTSSATEMACT